MPDPCPVDCRLSTAYLPSLPPPPLNHPPSRPCPARSSGFKHTSNHILNHLPSDRIFTPTWINHIPSTGYLVPLSQPFTYHPHALPIPGLCPTVYTIQRTFHAIVSILVAEVRPLLELLLEPLSAYQPPPLFPRPVGVQNAWTFSCCIGSDVFYNTGVEDVCFLSLLTMRAFGSPTSGGCVPNGGTRGPMTSRL